MSDIYRYLIVIAGLATLFLQMTYSVTATSEAEDLQVRFGHALVLVQQAEFAGATVTEVDELVKVLNEALELREDALKLSNSPDDSRKRAELLAQVDQLLSSGEARATQLRAVASQRTFTNTVIAYLSGIVAAILGTFAYAYAVSLWRKYRIKRTFQMKVSPR